MYFMRRVVKRGVVSLACCFFVAAGSALASVGVESGVSLVPREKLNNDVRLQTLSEKARVTDLAKIQYLLALIGNWPYTFIRKRAYGARGFVASALEVQPCLPPYSIC